MMAKLLPPDRTGVCICGVLVADHFDKRNAKLPCEKVQHSRCQVATAEPDQDVEPRIVMLRLVKSDRERPS